MCHLKIICIKTCGLFSHLGHLWWKICKLQMCNLQIAHVGHFFLGNSEQPQQEHCVYCSEALLMYENKSKNVLFALSKTAELEISNTVILCLF